MVTPTFNTAITVGDAIESVLANEYPRLDYLVVDRVSRDDTGSIARGYKPRVRVLEAETYPS
jgi:glycosyltransferase involved in cell wall biosynthesis